MRQLDPIRHCIIFHRISESDAGLYTVVATNPLGEAVCQANFVVEPGEGGAAGDQAFSIFIACFWEMAWTLPTIILPRNVHPA